MTAHPVPPHPDAGDAPGDSPVTRVRLLDASGAVIYRSTFPAGSVWMLDLWTIGIEYGMPMRIEVEESP